MRFFFFLFLALVLQCGMGGRPARNSDGKLTLHLSVKTVGGVSDTTVTRINNKPLISQVLAFVNDIWDTVGIEFAIDGIQHTKLADNLAETLDVTVPENEYTVYEFFKANNEPGIMNVYFVKNIIADRISDETTVGLCFSSMGRYAAVAISDLEFDYTETGMYYTAEVLAHEIGHLLLLGHVDDESNLMCPGISDNYGLTEDQIKAVQGLLGLL